MQTIRAMLERSGELLFDHSLSWSNADIEQYTKELQTHANCVIYGVELRNAGHLPLPPKYQLIDHHNEFSGYPPALEQIAIILGVEMSHYEQLVATNDSGYIGAMINLGATQEEIETIRAADRKAQGVTPEDEAKAVHAIANARRFPGLIVVQTNGTKFSPITDRLYPYDRLLIYSTRELMFYGNETRELARKFASLVATGAAFHGGGDCGFFGIACDVMSVDELENTVREIIDMLLTTDRV